MKIPVRMNIGYLQTGLIILFVALLTAFCKIAEFSLIIPLLFLFLGIYLFLLKKLTGKLLLRLGTLLSLLFIPVVVKEFLSFAISPLYIPVAGIAMLTMLLFNDLQLAFVMSLAGSILASLVLGKVLQPVNFHLSYMDMMFIFFLGSLTAAYTVRDARTRGKLMTSGLYVSIMQVITMVLLHHDMHFMVTKDYFLNYIRPLMVNGILASFFVVATLKIFEYAFEVLTNFSLLELSDKDQPLLKRMSMEAPGTYHHSMIVSDLAERAADIIGANTLLTRVGAYYHDIGKLVKSEYFTENQLMGGNKHDHIEPSISRLVILNHIKEGIELAKKHKLNPKIIEFIPQHHGTSLMYYFYQKALEEAEDESSVKEDNYRYPGPKPQNRETAIVLLADSVEGATRALDEQNPQKIEEVVRKIINNKFIDGQLDDCHLTLKEINEIAATFTRVLSAMYHGRVKYPDKKNGTSSPKKPEE